MIRTYPILLAPDPALAPTGGSNGGGSQDPRVVLAQMLTQRDSPAPAEPEESPLAAAEVAPEEPETPPAQGEPGEEISPEETPPAEGEELPPEDEPKEPEVPKAESADKGLPESVQRRIDKLTAQKYQAQEALDEARAETERLRAENEQLRNGTSAPSASSALPESVAKLKTPQEVAARLNVVDGQLDALQDFLDAHPGEMDTVHQIGDKQLTRQQLIEWRAQLRSEAKALPQRGQQLTAAATFQQQRQQKAAQLAEEFPQLRDAEHPDTKVARVLLKDPRFADVVEADYLALAMATGHRVLQAEKANRTPGLKPLTMTPPKPVAGKVPAGKPHAATGGGAGKPAGVTVKAALDAHGKSGSRSSFAALLATRDGR